jgi:hypothetical protein
LIDVDREVIYEVNLRATGPTHDFKAVESRVDAIRALGATTVWLMPVYPVGKERSAGGLGSPYAVADYTKPNPEFGTMEDFRRLVKKVHARKMKVVLDWVANHTAWDHPWISQHRDFYTLGPDGKPIIPPGTQWNDVAELNYDSKPMRSAMLSAMKGWIAEGVDGFRCDYTDGVPLDFWKEAIAACRASTRKPLLFLAEGEKKGLYGAGFDLTYDWRLFTLAKSLVKGQRPATDFVPALRSRSQATLRFITNHDEYAWNGSPAEQCGSAAKARKAMAIIGSAPGGALLLVTGQEAEVEGRIPFFDRSDVPFPSQPTEATRALSHLAAVHARAGGGLMYEDFSTASVLKYRAKRKGYQLDVMVNLTDQMQTVPGEAEPAKPDEVRITESHG